MRENNEERSRLCKTYKNVKENYLVKHISCLMNVCHESHVVITLVEDGTLDVQEEDGHNNSCSFETGHDSALNFRRRERLMTSKAFPNINYLRS
jgi:hypothetical protein